MLEVVDERRRHVEPEGGHRVPGAEPRADVGVGRGSRPEVVALLEDARAQQLRAYARGS
jgi:hypothetical protein